MNDEGERQVIWTIGILVVVMLALALVVLTWVSKAKAETFSEIEPVYAAYCALYARQMVFAELLHGRKPLAADSDVIKNVSVQHYADCVSVLPSLLPVPNDTGNFEQWVADIRELLMMRAKVVATLGTVPADENPKDEEWRRQCRAEYNTWDEDTGTVIRRGNPDRVPCPCMGEVQCVY